MADVTNLYPTTDSVIESMKGPRPSWQQVIIEGRAIPRLGMVDRGDRVDLNLDWRFSIDVPRDMAYQVAWFVANALAIGEGYAFLGAESKDQPFAPRAGALSEAP